MRYYILLYLILFLNISVYGQSEGIDYKVSNTDVNRIVCPSRINNIYTSEDQLLQLKISGSSLFVKFPIILTDTSGFSTKKLSSIPVGIFLECEDNTYSITLIPTSISSQTIHLLAPAKQFEIKAKATEDIITELVRIFVKNEHTYETLKTQHAYKLSKGIYVYMRSKTPLYGYTVYELYLYSPAITSLIDSELLSIPWFSAPAASALVENTWQGWNRAIIIDKGEL